MSGRQTVLIVSASAGAGHVRAGEALREAFEAAGTPADHVDVLALAPRWVRAAYGGGFKLLAARAPGVWRGIYTLCDGPAGDAARWGPVAHRILFRAFRRLLAAGRWRYGVCTHFLPTQLAAGSVGTPRFALVMTDFTLHRYWVQPRVRDYFVPDEAAARGVRRRLPAANVSVTGIPVGSRFAPADRARARDSFGLPQHARVVVVMGGGFGLGVDGTAEAALAAPVAGMHVLAVCGGNAEARARLDARAATDSRLLVSGHVDDVDRFMAAADVVITKPGGLSTSEALAVGRPMIVTRPIPGHEDANARLLVQAGAAIAARESADVTAALAQVFAVPGLRARMTHAAALAGRPHAANAIVRIVQQRLLRQIAA
jgi:processive 1,2-diacylglycerol beta-glucosyltransferase